MPPTGVAPALVALGLAAATTGCLHGPFPASADGSIPAETYTSEAFVRSRWLPPLEDGVTTRAEVVAALGEPTDSFEEQRIAAYRLLLVERAGPLLSSGYREIMFRSPFFAPIKVRAGTDERREALARGGVLMVARRTSGEELLLRELSREAEYSLVLVFDGHGALRRHRLLRIVP